MARFSVGRGAWDCGSPISFHVIEDFKERRLPIVDTDYRFGFMVKFQRQFEKVGLGIRFVPWNHESTHLGDEYTILASRDPAFERINVSYENWDTASRWKAASCSATEMCGRFATVDASRGEATATTRITCWVARTRRSRRRSPTSSRASASSIDSVNGGAVMLYLIGGRPIPDRLHLSPDG